MSYWKKFKKKYMGDRAFYRHYLLLAVPMILQNAITNRKPADFCVQSGNFWSGVGGKYFWRTVFWQWGSQGTYAFVSF